MNMESGQAASVKIMFLTGIAMLAFAANSILCRMSLGSGLIDAASFTTIRLVSGALCLVAIVSLREPRWRPGRPNWLAVLSLYAYMACFSFAYRSLTAGTGALLLFGFVQLTMIAVAVIRGERLSLSSWIGMALAMAGMVYLVMPGIEAPDPAYSALMAMAGLAWGAYSLLGIGKGDHTTSTASNFLYATPLAALGSLIESDNVFLSWQGCLLAVVSGAIASGMGYAIWYRVLKSIKAASAAVVQLSVPALATLGGVVLLAEPLTSRTVAATALTIGGIYIAVKRPGKKV